jgi:hypothetical protein
MVGRAELKPLEPLVGRWRTSGRTIADPVVDISGTDVYEWLDDGFLVHHADVVMGDERSRTIELIGDPDPGDDSFVMRAFDSTGTFTEMNATVDGDVWTFAGKDSRAFLTVGGDRMSARWERQGDDGDWQPWMDMEFSRMPD